ncbi:MAG: hypothetical protein IT375_19910 [Polyangiaceae bacterium]|nr:hypothetical protein [Polyangiaceae bacterium]
MNKNTQKTLKSIEKLRLPELQARFAEIVGEASRSPNRKFLVRRIAETLEARGNDSATETPKKEPKGKGRRAEKPTPEPVTAPEVANDAATPEQTEAAEAPRPRGRFATMSVEELQAKYLEAVGRATGSDDRRYLIWKIREAEKGRIPVGPRPARTGEPADVKILPLRLESAVVERMDDAWRTRGIKNRMEFFRRALGHYLTHLGATDAASMFTAETDVAG